MLRRLKLLVVLLTLSLVLAGCNRVGLAYRNLDVIIPWTLNDYLDMNAGQKSWFNDNLKAHLACPSVLGPYWRSVQAVIVRPWGQVTGKRA